MMRASAIICRQTLFKVNIVPQEVSTYRYMHLVRQVKKTSKSSLLDLHRNCKVVAVPLVRFASTNETVQSIPSLETTASETIAPETVAPQINPFDEIPDPPTPLQEIIENIVKLHPNGEPTFQSIGLGGWTPVGLIQRFFEFTHIGLDVPWWATIVIGTLTVRLLMFPLVVMAQKNAIKFANHMPKMQELQMKMTEARNYGDHVESARAASELMKFMTSNKVSPVKNLMMPLIQAPVFLSFFLALRKMANVPVESLKEGGFLWMKDLTVHDPYYIMPIITSLTMYTTIELGTDGMNLRTMGLMRYVLRVLPFAILPFMLHFPGTVLTYWVSTNFISLAQTGLLKVPYIRKKLNMPILNPLPPSSIEKSSKGFIAEFKESWTNIKLSKQLENRGRVDEMQFSRAGKGPLVKTFKYDPTKQSNIYAKKR